MSYEHGNWDFDHGCIKPLDDPENYSFSYYNIKDPIERERIKNLWRKRNKERCFTPSHHIAYCELYEKNHGGWHHQRKQNTSSIMRRHYQSTANKKTRQAIKIEMKNELNDL
jgi:hypothetical protein